jgi:hypothetical protein
MSEVLCFAEIISTGVDEASLSNASAIDGFCRLVMKTRIGTFEHEIFDNISRSR